VVLRLANKSRGAAVYPARNKRLRGLRNVIRYSENYGEVFNLSWIERGKRRSARDSSPNGGRWPAAVRQTESATGSFRALESTVRTCEVQGQSGQQIGVAQMNSPPIKCEAPCGNGATLKHRTTNELDTTASSAFVYFFLRAQYAPIKLSRTYARDRAPSASVHQNIHWIHKLWTYPN
jgi:hypothetical protein